MTTTHVSRGAGRPAAAARKAKHDQRTPLPPRGTVIDVSKTAQAEEIADAVRPSGTKAVLLAAFARESGWEASVESGQTGTVTVNMKRTTPAGPQSARATWYDGRILDRDLPESTLAGNSSKWRNVSALKQSVLTIPAEQVVVRTVRVPSKSGNPAARQTTKAVAVALPFALTDSPEKIIKALAGRRITWTPSHGRELQHARVSDRLDRITVRPTPANGRLYFEFNEVGGSARAVYLDAIVAVSPR